MSLLSLSVSALWQRAVRSRQRSLQSIISNNLCGNRRSSCGLKLLPSNCWSADPARISPEGDEVALFSAVRHSDIPATSAVFTSRAFGCGCAALRNFYVYAEMHYYLGKSAQRRAWLLSRLGSPCRSRDLAQARAINPLRAMCRIVRFAMRDGNWNRSWQRLLV